MIFASSKDEMHKTGSSGKGLGRVYGRFQVQVPMVTKIYLSKEREREDGIHEKKNIKRAIICIFCSRRREIESRQLNNIE